ncbi:hypothetical protein Pan216_45790 [Planctomycetes bacterium Pan216]|uniref:Uncharacterized protein n=1 Tax=Kolteria novifilia TaxID=2527975 RepID=A0A518B9N3_9BACT|nr:hypothetical protein Pan216_45790 [Planctomycetes bacterium Pan216]
MPDQDESFGERIASLREQVARLEGQLACSHDLAGRIEQMNDKLSTVSDAQKRHSYLWIAVTVGFVIAFGVTIYEIRSHAKAIVKKEIDKSIAGEAIGQINENRDKARVAAANAVHAASKAKETLDSLPVKAESGQLRIKGDAIVEGTITAKTISAVNGKVRLHTTDDGGSGRITILGRLDILDSKTEKPRIILNPKLGGDTFLGLYDNKGHQRLTAVYWSKGDFPAIHFYDGKNPKAFDTLPKRK